MLATLGVTRIDQASLEAQVHEQIDQLFGQQAVQQQAALAERVRTLDAECRSLSALLGDDDEAEDGPRRKRGRASCELSRAEQLEVRRARDALLAKKRRAEQLLARAIDRSAAGEAAEHSDDNGGLDSRIRHGLATPFDTADGRLPQVVRRHRMPSAMTPAPINIDGDDDDNNNNDDDNNNNDNNNNNNNNNNNDNDDDLIVDIDGLSDNDQNIIVDSSSSSDVDATYLELTTGDEEVDDEDTAQDASERRRQTIRRLSKSQGTVIWVDDGDDVLYQRRLQAWQAERAAESEEVELGDELRLPASLYDKLFEYQQTALQWLWALHQQEVGGVLGDEMGLGKTVQVAAFLAALQYSGKLDGLPVLIVCPATVLKHWVQELHVWWPPFRVVVFHSSGSAGDCSGRALLAKLRPAAAAAGGVLLTTYSGLRDHQATLAAQRWSYVVLDEGHKIRNPDSGVTLAAKRMKSPHRLILSGAPIQNRLVELWSLFDFVYPGKLGTLPVFEQEFALPITAGGYANASRLQEQIAHRCAVVLRDTIAPFLLRRMKADVRTQLPAKSEQVLMCRLTAAQRRLYVHFLESSQVRAVLDGRRNLLGSIMHLRKICNHPDLLLSPGNNADVAEQLPADYGTPARSAKLALLQQLLPMWKEQGHRVLVFSQTVIMLDMIEQLVQSLQYDYLRMDGTTSIGARMPLIDTFNKDERVFVFLLTTRVGGVGVNLTGADRVLLFDPDWNPAVDIQARERAWRIGQTRPVTIYRLLTQGTVEKIYHRQIFKQFLTDKVLTDAKHRRFFKSNLLHDLFTYDDDDDDHHHHGYGHDSTAHSLSETSALMINAQVDAEIQADDLAEQTYPDDSRDDVHILRRLFENDGISSALQHDAIVGATAADAGVQLSEAARQAETARQRLAQSRDLCRQSSVDVPTWTGRAGRAGAPFARSSAILSALQSKLAGHPAPPVQARNQLLPDQIVAYLQARDGQASTAQLIRHFAISVDDEAALLTFRQLLRSVAALNKQRGVWTLRSGKKRRQQ